MPGVSLYSNMKTWQADIPWQWERQPFRQFVFKKGWGRVGREKKGDSELKLRRSWDISPQDILRQSTKIHNVGTCSGKLCQCGRQCTGRNSSTSEHRDNACCALNACFRPNVPCAVNWVQGIALPDSGVTVTPRSTGSSTGYSLGCPGKDKASKVGISRDLYQLGTTVHLLGSASASCKEIAPVVMEWERNNC